MTVVYPTATKSQGNVSVTVVQTIASLSAPDLSAEINAGTSVDVSCFLYSGGSTTTTTNKGNAPRRICTTNQLEQFGNTTYDVVDLQYVYNPQADGTDPANKAKATLTPGSSVYLIFRNGLDAQNTAYAAGQFCDIVHVKLGPQNRGMTGDGEFDEFAISQSVVALAPPTYDAVIVA